MRSHLQGCALKLQTVKSHQAMAEAMSNTAKAMVSVLCVITSCLYFDKTRVLLANHLFISSSILTSYRLPSLSHHNTVKNEQGRRRACH
jgi:hypothetical protein